MMSKPKMEGMETAASYDYQSVTNFLHNFKFAQALNDRGRFVATNVATAIWSLPVAGRWKLNLDTVVHMIEYRWGLGAVI